jgi:hypothetical protein
MNFVVILNVISKRLRKHRPGAGPQADPASDPLVEQREFVFAILIGLGILALILALILA